jgi:hypothetical protein
MDSLKEEQSEDSGNTVRKPYSTPQVQIYGNLRDITQSVMGSGLSDGGGTQAGGNNRTS